MGGHTHASYWSSREGLTTVEDQDSRMELREDTAQGALAHPTPPLLTLTTPTSSLHPHTSSLHPHSPVPPAVLQCADIVHDSPEQFPGAWARVDLSDLSLPLGLLHELQLRGEGSGPGRPEVVVHLF